MDEELTILTNPDGSGPVVISIGAPTGAATPPVITSIFYQQQRYKIKEGKMVSSLEQVIKTRFSQ